MLGGTPLPALVQRAAQHIPGVMAQTVNTKLVHQRDTFEATVPAYTTFGQLKVGCGSCLKQDILKLTLHYRRIGHLLYWMGAWLGREAWTYCRSVGGTNQADVALQVTST